MGKETHHVRKDCPRPRERHRRAGRTIEIGAHRLAADEPGPIGTETGPTPVEPLLAGLGARTSGWVSPASR
ncbi:OsmC family protein [Streptomyces sp. NPDC058335]|uniref:OsmC family protein n=1 Tax=Streptomyces sp. NPDC058335 TaxID=3346451 RepID=UPI00365D555A